MIETNVTYPDEPSWLEARRHSIGASEAAAILDQSPWMNAYTLWLLKTGRMDPDPPSPQMLMGQRMERHIAALVQDEYPHLALHYPPQWTVYYYHDWPRMSATPDVFSGKDAVLEIKNIGAWSKSEWADGVPLHYQIQVQQQMACTGKARGYVAALIGGQDLVLHEVQRSDRFIRDVLLPGLQRFWEHVETDTPPEIDGSEATKRAIAKAWPEAVQPEPVALPRDVEDSIDRIEEIRAVLKPLEAEKQMHENRIKGAMQDAERGFTINGRKVSYKTVSLPERTLAPTTYRKLHIHKETNE